MLQKESQVPLSVWQQTLPAFMAVLSKGADPSQPLKPELSLLLSGLPSTSAFGSEWQEWLSQ